MFLIEELVPAPDPAACCGKFLDLPYLVFLDGQGAPADLARYSYLTADPWEVVRGQTRETIRIDRSKAGVVKAADILHDESVEIINPDHILCTMTEDVPFVVEMTVENGRGYRPAAEGHNEELEVGGIPIDAIFSPVSRVEYKVEETRVGQKTNYDKLTLEIWTNGSVHPEMALVEAAKILRKHLNPFVQYAELGPKVHAPARGGVIGGDGALEQKLGMSLAELKLSVRAMNCLESENIHTVRDLVQKTEDQLLEVRNFGETTLNEVREKLAIQGLKLRGD